MADALSELAAAVVRDLTEATGVPIAVSDGRGKLLAASDPAHMFCPLLLHEEGRAPPLPPRCEGCPRADALLAGQPERLPHCPHGSDAIRAVMVSGATAGFLVTAILPKEFHEAAERAEKELQLTALPLAAAIATERRERAERDHLSQRLLVARLRATRALLALPPEAPARRDLEIAKAELDLACEALQLFRATRSAAAEVAAEAEDASAGEAATDY